MVTACVLNCSDVHCTDASHKMEIDDLMIEVLLSIEDGADTHIPQPKTFISSKKNSNISKL